MLRNMTSIYLEREGKLLLLHRIGSRVFSEPVWLGIGGHFEPQELNDPERCVLRELYEETGIPSGALRGLRLKYITLRVNGEEIRQNYYFFAELMEGVSPGPCNEGELAWVDGEEALRRNMPLSARVCLEHYLRQGRHDDCRYAGVGTSIDGEAAVVLTPLVPYC